MKKFIVVFENEYENKFYFKEFTPDKNWLHITVDDIKDAEFVDKLEADLILSWECKTTGWKFYIL